MRTVFFGIAFVLGNLLWLVIVVFVVVKVLQAMGVL